MTMSLHNNLIDACVIVGMDEQTGLLPIPNASSRSEKENGFVEDELGPFQLNVLAVLTGTTAFFPYQQTEISGIVHSLISYSLCFEHCFISLGLCPKCYTL